MTGSGQGSAIGDLLDKFGAVDRDQRERVIEEFAAHNAQADARHALMQLLREEAVAEYREGDHRWISPRGWSEDWRNSAFRILTEAPDASAEVFAFLREMATEGKSWDHRGEAVRRLLAHYAGHAETYHVLIKCADRRIKEAFEGIARNYGHRPAALPYLVEGAIWNDCRAPIEEAVNALARHHADHPETRPLLLRLAGEHKSLAAIRALAELPPGDPVVCAFLTGVAGQDEDPNQAGIAMRSLMQADPNGKESMSLLMDRARHAKPPTVRKQAITALCDHGTDDPRLLPLLLECAKSDKSHWSRQAAVKGLASRYTQSPEAEASVISRAASDPSLEVRAMAVEMLGVHFSGNPRARDRLISRLRKDRSDQVRSAAAAALRRGFGSSPAARRALREEGYAIGSRTPQAGSDDVPTPRRVQEKPKRKA